MNHITTATSRNSFSTAPSCMKIPAGTLSVVVGEMGQELQQVVCFVAESTCLFPSSVRDIKALFIQKNIHCKSKETEVLASVRVAGCAINRLDLQDGP